MATGYENNNVACVQSCSIKANPTDCMRRMRH